jgi:hypothetical protein
MSKLNWVTKGVAIFLLWAATAVALPAQTTVGSAAQAQAVASPAPIFATLHSFCLQTKCPDGSNPIAGLTQAADGNIYGTTSLGGADDGN